MHTLHTTCPEHLNTVLYHAVVPISVDATCGPLCTQLLPKLTTRLRGTAGSGNWDTRECAGEVTHKPEAQSEHDTQADRSPGPLRAPCTSHSQTAVSAKWRPNACHLRRHAVQTAGYHRGPLCGGRRQGFPRCGGAATAQVDAVVYYIVAYHFT